MSVAERVAPDAPKSRTISAAPSSLGLSAATRTSAGSTVSSGSPAGGSPRAGTAMSLWLNPVATRAASARSSAPWGRSTNLNLTWPSW